MELPTGTVTFLFADIEGGNRLWQSAPREMSAALARHDEILRASVEQHGGFVISAAGDSFAAAFGRSADAVAAALTAQRSLRLQEQFGGSTVRVRMGLHTGEADQREGNYFGQTFNRGVRLMAAGHGGQVLLSNSTAAQVRRFLPNGAQLISLASHRLKDLSGVGDVLQLVHPDLIAKFPPLRSPDPGRVLVGRDHELSQLRMGLDGAAAGHGSVWLLSGEPGVGKSRLISEITGRARRRGFRVATGRCLEQEGAPVLWPWRQVLASVLEGCDPGDRLSVLGPAVADLAGLLPDAGAPQPTADRSPPDHHSSSGSFRLMEGLSGALRRAAQKQPMVVVLEDVHWADASSLAALQFTADFVEDAPLMIVASLCPHAAGTGAKADRLPAFLGKLLHAPFATLLSVGGLDEPAVQTLAEHYVGAEVAPAIGSRIYRETDGNAFLVTELLRSGGRLPGSADPTEPLPVPEAVSNVVESRFRNLRPPTVSLLSLASVIGREFDVALLAAGAGLPADDVQEALAEAGALGLVENCLSGMFRFSHGLLQQAIYQRLPWREQVELHARLADVLACLVDGPRSDWLPALAHHRGMAVRGHPEQLGDAVAAGLRVAEQAWAKLAREDAVDALERTLRLVESVPGASANRRSSVLLALGEAQHRAGLSESAMVTFSSASCCSDGDVEVLARASMGFEDACMASGRDRRSTGDPATEILEHTLAELGPEHDRFRARVEARLARARWFSGDEDCARRLINELLLRPIDPDDTETRLAVLLARRIIASPPDDAEERLTIAADVAALAEGEGRYEVALDAIRTRVLTLVELGRLADADDEIELFARRLEGWREPLFSPFGPIFRAMRDLQTGRFDDAVLQLARAGKLADRTQSAIARQLITMQRYSLARWAAPETLSQYIAAFEAFVGRTGSGTTWNHALLRLSGELGRWEDVTARLNRSERNVAGTWIELLPMHEFWSFSMGLLAPVLAAVGTETERAAAYHALLPRRSLLVGNVAPTTGPLEHSLGVLAEARGDHDTALVHLAAAVRSAERLGTQPWLVEALAAQAHVHRIRRLPLDDRAAVALEQRASRIARSIGMVLPAAPGSSTGVPASVARLSAREREVLALLVTGKSNQEIAAELFISYRTVKTHVSHILDKLGTRDRTNAALLAHRVGL